MVLVVLCLSGFIVSWCYFGIADIMISRLKKQKDKLETYDQIDEINDKIENFVLLRGGSKICMFATLTAILFLYIAGLLYKFLA